VNHKYEVGQTLRLLQSRTLSWRRAGNYQVVALLPYEGHSLQYRIKSGTMAQEYVVSESDLVLPLSVSS